MDDISVIAVVFPKDVDEDTFKEVVRRAKETMGEIPGVSVRLAISDAAQTISYFLENGELPEGVEET